MQLARQLDQSSTFYRGELRTARRSLLRAVLLGVIFE